MKKCLAIFLSVLMLLPLALPMTAQAEELIEPSTNQSVPNILLRGDGNAIYDGDGNRIYKFDELLTGAFSGDDDSDQDDGDSNLKESAMNVIKSFILGVATGDYDEYYEKLQFEVAELTEKIQMDENGDPQYGTDIISTDYTNRNKLMTTPNRKAAYNYAEYPFYYDWRRSPMEIADDLDAFVDAVCEMTGHAQVTLTGACLGSNFVLAYFAKYGSKNRIKGLGFDCGVMYGQDALSESISGKFKTDGDAINRYLADAQVNNDVEIPDWVKDLIDFAEHAELLHGLSIVTRATIYDKVVEGVSSALALSTQFTMPGYWSCVSLQDYDDALLYIFGEEGSEKREKYAGLIEKIEAYHDQVQVNIDSMLTDFAANGGNIGVFVKYGFQMTPICESRNLVSDDIVSVRYASMGATTSMLYNTLTDDYIAQKEAEGKGKYISGDWQVDASTGLFPDSTWFLKGVQHSNWRPYEEAILYTVIAADRQLTVEDLNRPRFTVATPSADGNFDYAPMTADNSHTENWEAETPKEEHTKVSRVFRFLLSFFGVFRHLITFLKEKFG
ncbi:MAG: alpha/beta fold hydrolase [Clostridia bacterium]|nr:alpha/beta fold hydrolase [Clostridia bacterium]